MATEDLLLITGLRDSKLLGYIPRASFPDADLPECLVVGSRVFVLLEDCAVDIAEQAFLLAMRVCGLPVVGRYAEIGAYNFDTIKLEGRGPSNIVWMPGCSPMGEPEKPAPASPCEKCAALESFAARGGRGVGEAVKIDAMAHTCGAED